MSERVPIIDGDFVVLMHHGNVEVLQVIKVSPAFLFFREKQWTLRGDGKMVERRISRDVVVFAGPRATAEMLAEQLTSSRALEDDERRAVVERRIKREQKLIERAKQGSGA